MLIPLYVECPPFIMSPVHYLLVLIPSKNPSVIQFPNPVRAVMSGETPMHFNGCGSTVLTAISALQAWEPLMKTLCPSPRVMRAAGGMDEASFLLLGSKVSPLIPICRHHLALNDHVCSWHDILSSDVTTLA